jgi:hypothetical protein
MEKITPLRARMTEDMRVRGLGEKAQRPSAKTTLRHQNHRFLAGFGSR